MKLIIDLSHREPYLNFPPDYSAMLQAEFPQVRITHLERGQRGRLKDLITDADALATWAIDAELFKQAKRLRWIQAAGTGVERILKPDVVESAVTVTNYPGDQSVTIAEQVLGVMICFARKLHQAVVAQRDRRWSRQELCQGPIELDRLQGKTLGIVGLGRIGKAVASRARAFGMRIMAVKRHPSQHYGGVDLVLSLERLPELLAASDYVLLSCPLTPATRGLMGEPELRQMKSGAYLINVARGQIVDEPALIRALREGWIAGAALDVFEREPLPADSPLWELPQVILTPHHAGLYRYWPGFVELFRENIRRFLNQEPLLNRVEKRVGY